MNMDDNGREYTPIGSIKQYDVVKWNENVRSFYRVLRKDELYIVLNNDGTYLAITSETLVGWKPEEQTLSEQEKYVLAIENGWECYHVDHRNFIKVGNSEGGVVKGMICLNCRYDCKRFVQEECPLYEGRI